MSGSLGRRFWAVWAGSSASFLGEGLLLGAVPLLASSLTRDARLISITDALQQAGWLFLGLASGIAADRLPRLRIMWLANAARALAAAVFAGVVVIGHASMPVIYALGLSLGLASPFFDNASSAVLPELVAPEQFQRANSLTQMSIALTINLVGPIAGTALFVLAPASPFGLTALAYAIATGITLAVSRRNPGVGARTGKASNTELLREGLRYLLGHRVLVTLAVTVGMVNLVTSGEVAILVLYVLQVLHLPASAYGLVMAAFAVGALAGAALTARITAWIGERTAVLVSLGSFGVTLLVLGTLPIVAIAFTAMAVTGFFAMVWNVTVNSYRQRVVPIDLLGRVTSVYRMVAFLTMPLGALSAGLIAHTAGLQTTYALGGVLLLATTVAVLLPLRGMPNNPDADTGAADPSGAVAPTEVIQR